MGTGDLLRAQWPFLGPRGHSMSPKAFPEAEGPSQGTRDSLRGQGTSPGAQMLSGPGLSGAQGPSQGPSGPPSCPGAVPGAQGPKGSPRNPALPGAKEPSHGLRRFSKDPGALLVVRPEAQGLGTLPEPRDLLRGLLTLTGPQEPSQLPRGPPMSPEDDPEALPLAQEPSQGTKSISRVKGPEALAGDQRLSGQRSLPGAFPGGQRPSGISREASQEPRGPPRGPAALPVAQVPFQGPKDPKVLLETLSGAQELRAPPRNPPRATLKSPVAKGLSQGPYQRPIGPQVGTRGPPMGTGNLLRAQGPSLGPRGHSMSPKAIPEAEGPQEPSQLPRGPPMSPEDDPEALPGDQEHFQVPS
ncbi:basic salivary proline-rich protein 1-like [Homarus americanus]|uniref:basic salivary proline-rich protein 1-like n=1 Tax=Homarus americanus TaxID=6706 RepID=UPI001C44E659|nr:basic salivary proline-rich protein 1-like [Homarus americanus]